MDTLVLNIESAKRTYDWFHHAFPDYKNNNTCSQEDINLRNKLEEWLLANGE